MNLTSTEAILLIFLQIGKQSKRPGLQILKLQEKILEIVIMIHMILQLTVAALKHLVKQCLQVYLVF